MPFSPSLSQTGAGEGEGGGGGETERQTDREGGGVERRVGSRRKPLADSVFLGKKTSTAFYRHWCWATLLVTIVQDLGLSSRVSKVAFFIEQRLRAVCVLDSDMK